MAIQKWSDNIWVVDLPREPQLSEDLAELTERLREEPAHIVLNLERLAYLNSSHLAKLLRVRKRLIETDMELRLCSVPDSVWGVMLVTGLDQVFEFSQDVPSALASLQIDEDD